MAFSPVLEATVLSRWCPWFLCMTCHAASPLSRVSRCSVALVCAIRKSAGLWFAGNPRAGTRESMPRDKGLTYKKKRHRTQAPTARGTQASAPNDSDPSDAQPQAASEPAAAPLPLPRRVSTRVRDAQLANQRERNTALARLAAELGQDTLQPRDARLKLNPES